MAKKKVQEVEEKITSIETFRDIGNWEMRNLTDNNPSCFNGIVRVEKFKITIEKIEEPKEVYQERLQKLWEESDNHHHHLPITNKAKHLGIELKGNFGEKRVRK